MPTSHLNFLRTEYGSSENLKEGPFSFTVTVPDAMSALRYALKMR
jgi:hypothetical protein